MRRQQSDKLGLSAVLRVSTFRWLLVASFQSAIGDQVARVAVTVLVFSRTHSAVVTSVFYALSFVPAVAGGVLLGPIGDRVPRKVALVGADLARTVLVTAMALGRPPLVVLGSMLVVSVLLGSVYRATEPALVADLFGPVQRRAASTVRSSMAQIANVVGFGAGGAIVAVVGARGGLLVDAASFAVSAVLLQFGLTARGELGDGPSDGAQDRADREDPEKKAGRPVAGRLGIRAIAEVFGSPQRREVLALSWLMGFWIVPEGLAAPYAAHHSTSSVQIGLLLAAPAAGATLGVFLIMGVIPPVRRHAAARAMAVGTGLPLIACVGYPDARLAMALWFVSGIGTAYQVQLWNEFVDDVPADRRAAALGVAGGGLTAVQGIGAVAGGAIASLSSPAVSVAVAGAVGSVLALLAIWRRLTRISSDHSSHAIAIICNHPQTSVGTRISEGPPITALLVENSC